VNARRALRRHLDLHGQPTDQAARLGGGGPQAEQQHHQPKQPRTEAVATRSQRCAVDRSGTAALAKLSPTRRTTFLPMPRSRIQPQRSLRPSPSRRPQPLHNSRPAWALSLERNQHPGDSNNAWGISTCITSDNITRSLCEIKATTPAASIAGSPVQQEYNQPHAQGNRHSRCAPTGLIVSARPDGRRQITPRGTRGQGSPRPRQACRPHHG